MSSTTAGAPRLVRAGVAVALGVALPVAVIRAAPDEQGHLTPLPAENGQSASPVAQTPPSVPGGPGALGALDAGVGFDAAATVRIATVNVASSTLDVTARHAATTPAADALAHPVPAAAHRSSGSGTTSPSGIPLKVHAAQPEDDPAPATSSTHSDDPDEAPTPSPAAGATPDPVTQDRGTPDETGVASHRAPSHAAPADANASGDDDDAPSLWSPPTVADIQLDG